MSQTLRKNPIEHRLDELARKWLDFTEDPLLQVLCWQIDDDSARMVETFLRLQQEEVHDILDLFITFQEPFETAEIYGEELRLSLIRQFEEVRVGIAEEGIDPSWQPPPVDPGGDAISSLIKTCHSLREYYDDLMDHVALVISPHVISDASLWRAWWSALLEHDIPAEVRFLVVEHQHDAALAPVVDENPERFFSESLELDMPGAYLEILQGVPGGGAGFSFRKLYVALANAAAVGNLVVAEQTAAQALRIAQQEGWPQMQTAVQMAMGAAYFAQGKTQQTLQCYRQASDAVAGEEDPAAAKLQIQTLFAQAAVLFGDEEYESAATLYEEIVPLAEQQQDLFAHLESHRMAAHCWEQTGRFEQAWQHAQQALDVGAKMEEKDRRNSTIPYVGQCLLRLVDAGSGDTKVDEVRARLVELVGPDWEDQTVGAAAS